MRQDRGGQIRLHLIHLGQERWIISSLIDSPYLGKKIIEIIHMNLKRGEKKNLMQMQMVEMGWALLSF